MDVAVTRSAKVGKERLVGRSICTGFIVRAFLKPGTMRLTGVPVASVPATFCRSANVLGVFGRRRTVRFKSREPVGAQFRIRVHGAAACNRVSARTRCGVKRIRCARRRCRVSRIGNARARSRILAIFSCRRKRSAVCGGIGLTELLYSHVHVNPDILLSVDNFVDMSDFESVLLFFVVVVRRNFSVGIIDNASIRSRGCLVNDQVIATTDIFDPTRSNHLVFCTGVVRVVLIGIARRLGGITRKIRTIARARLRRIAGIVTASANHGNRACSKHGLKQFTFHKSSLRGD